MKSPLTYLCTVWLIVLECFHLKSVLLLPVFTRPQAVVTPKECIYGVHTCFTAFRMPGAITHFYRCINLAMNSLVWPDPVSFILMCRSFKVSVCGWREETEGCLGRVWDDVFILERGGGETRLKMLCACSNLGLPSSLITLRSLFFHVRCPLRHTHTHIRNHALTQGLQREPFL